MKKKTFDPKRSPMAVKKKKKRPLNSKFSDHKKFDIKKTDIGHFFFINLGDHIKIDIKKTMTICFRLAQVKSSIICEKKTGCACF
jgi:hypothetical protein